MVKIGESYFSKTQKYLKKKLIVVVQHQLKEKLRSIYLKRIWTQKFCWYFNWKIEWFQRFEQWCDKLQFDNNSKHKSLAAYEFLNSNNVKCIDWPAYIHDLNLI